jgi:hypothetical protein
MRPAARYASTQLLYVLDRDSTLGGNGIAIQVVGRQRKKNGEWGKPQPAPVSADEIERLPDAADREIVALLLGAAEAPAYGQYYSSNFTRASFRLTGPLVDKVLPMIGRSERLLLRTGGADKEALTILGWDGGPPWKFRLQVSLATEGAIEVDGVLVRGDRRMAATEPQMVLSAGFLIADGNLAPLDHGGAVAWLVELRRAGVMQFPRSAAPRLAEAFARSRVDPETLPDDLRYERVDVGPRPRVRMGRASAGHQYARREDLQAVTEFDYDGSVVPAHGGSATYDSQRRRLVIRDAAAEQDALQRLQQLGFRRGWAQAGNPGQLTVAVDQFPRAVRTLVREGWHVEADGRVFRAPRSFNVHVKSGIDWFELHGTVDFGEGRSASIADLLAALRRGDATVVLDDGTRGMVPEDWLKRYLRIASFGETEGDHIRYRPTQTALLDALLEDQPAVTIDDAFGRARAELQKFSGIRPMDPPESFAGTLREYQREALGISATLRLWRLPRRRYGPRQDGHGSGSARSPTNTSRWSRRT